MSKLAGSMERTMSALAPSTSPIASSSITTLPDCTRRFSRVMQTLRTMVISHAFSLPPS
jgi:hypothetical protein